MMGEKISAHLQSGVENMEDIRRPSAAKHSLKESRQHWFDTYRILSQLETDHLLLESGRGGKYSIIGLRPFAKLRGKNGRLAAEENGKTTVYEGPLLESIRSWLNHYKAEKDASLPDFQGGIAGQFSYDLVREFEKLPEHASDDLLTEDVFLLAFDELYVIDHEKDIRWDIIIDTDTAGAERKLEKMNKQWMEAEHQELPALEGEAAGGETPLRSLSEEAFTEAVAKTKDYIAGGDVFQVNLSVRESRPLRTSPMHIYSCLRKINPSPYMSYMHTPELQYIGASPELLVKVAGEEVSTRPIAGTRSRGKTDAEDRELAETLLNNEKERAEHIMLVDLERNDLGRVCAYGTVEVDELMVIEKYSHVQHIVSNVKGKKAPGCDTLDVIAAAFPGGTITGAPKIRTMEIIEELEPVRRGAYTGSMGWIGFNGDMELNITIRTMIARHGTAHVQAGAGIVIDSEPRAEYRECLKKARALWKAKEQSEEETEQRRMLK